MARSAADVFRKLTLTTVDGGDPLALLREWRTELQAEARAAVAAEERRLALLESADRELAVYDELDAQANGAPPSEGGDEHKCPVCGDPEFVCHHDEDPE